MAASVTGTACNGGLTQARLAINIYAEALEARRCANASTKSLDVCLFQGPELHKTLGSFSSMFNACGQTKWCSPGWS